MKKIFKLVYLLLLSIILVGCWDAQELDTLFIVSGIAIDKSSVEGQIDVTLQVIKTTATSKGSAGSNSGSQADNVIIFKQTEKTVLAAIEVLNYNNNRNIFLEHNQIILVGKELAELGMNRYIDFFLRNDSTRMETLLLIVEGRADEVLKGKIDQDQNTGTFLYHQINNINKTTKYFMCTLLDYTSKIMEKQSSAILPIIKIEDKTEEEKGEKKEEEKKEIKIKGLALFRQDKMVEVLVEDETIDYLWFYGDAKQSWISVVSELGTIVLYIDIIKTEKKISINNNKIYLHLKVNATMKGGELRDIKIDDPRKLIELLPKVIEEDINRRLVEIFQLSQQYNLDIFDIGVMIKRNHPNKWKELEANWSTLYPTIQIGIESRVVIPGIGQIVKTLEMENQS